MTVIDTRRGTSAGVASELIPKDRYLSKEWLALENERLWPRVWQFACREEEIPNIGDYVEYTIADQSLLVVRESTDRIRAFRNACLHRGTRLAAGCGTLRDGELRCRFHGWAWALDGSIAEVPDAHDFAPERVTRTTLQLPEALVDTWGGFVFVNMDRDARPLREFLGPVPALYDRFEPERMRILRYRTTILECNWKTGLDAFNEAYHVEATHTWDLSGMAAKYGLQAVSQNRYGGRDPSGATRGSYAMQFEMYENQNLMSFTERFIETGRRVGDLGADPRSAVLDMLKAQISISLAHEDELRYVEELHELPVDMLMTDFFAMVRRGSVERYGLDYSRFTTYDILATHDFCIYPNVVGPITAGNWIVFRFRPNGDNPDSCLWDVLFLHQYGEDEEVREVTREWYADWREHDEWGPAIDQDLSNFAHIQRGMHETTYPGLRLNRQEEGIRNFHRFLDRYID